MEEFDYSWQKGLPVHFILEKPEPYDAPGDFTRLRLQMKGQPEFSLSNEDGWIEYNSQEQRSPVYANLSRENLARSKYVLILPDSGDPALSPLLFLRSWAYASDPERLHVIGFRANSKPDVIFNELFDLTEFSDVDQDGSRELVGVPCLSEDISGRNGEVTTYTPFRVYKISRPALGVAVLSLELSEAYNVRNNGGWAGAECSNEYAIYRAKNKKPRVLPVKEAQKLVTASN